MKKENHIEIIGKRINNVFETAMSEERFIDCIMPIEKIAEFQPEINSMLHYTYLTALADCIDALDIPRSSLNEIVEKIGETKNGL